MFKDHGTGGMRDMHKICQKKYQLRDCLLDIEKIKETLRSPT